MEEMNGFDELATRSGTRYQSWSVVGKEEYHHRRKYSSADLRTFKFSFNLPRTSFNLIDRLNDLGILRTKIRRRGNRAGKQRKTSNGGYSVRVIHRECNGNNRVKFKRGSNHNNLISLSNPYVLYKYPMIMFNNCRSIRNKFGEVQAHIELKNPDVAVFVETWIESSEVDSFELDGYIANHRIRDRNDKSHGGGTSIYIKNEISIISTNFPIMKEVEAITVMYRTTHMQREIPWTAIIAVYSPPNDLYASECIEYILEEVDRLKAINMNANIMVLGDFNDLKIDGRLRKPYFNQIINEKTCNDKIIDKCFYNGIIDYSVRISAPISTSDHGIVELIPNNYIPNINNTVTYQCRPKRRSCYNHMGRALSNTRWEKLLKIDDCDKAAEYFHSFIVSKYEDSFPIVIVKKKNNSKSWFNAQIAEAIKKRDIYYKNKEILQFKESNIRVKQLIKEAKCKEYDRMIKLIENKSIDYHKLVKPYIANNNINNNKIIFPELSEEESLSEIVSFFNNILNQHPPLNVNELPSFLPGLPPVLVDEQYVYSQLKKIGVTKSAGPDRIPNFVLKEYAVELTLPITFLLNKSLQQGYCPLIWKKNYLVTLPKKKIVKSPNDIRPIVISSPLVKILEKHIVKIILSEAGERIDKCQFGGMPGRSAEHYITFYLDYVTKNLEKAGNRVTALVTDFTKAFDAVDHLLFVRKLIDFNIQSAIVKWVISFLMDRSIVIKNKDKYSTELIKCSNGAPQGSVLGGMMFLIVVNEIGASYGPSLKYVDDMTILCTQTAREDGSLPQKIMELLLVDSLNTKMSLNTQKCQYMVHCFARDVSCFNINLGEVCLAEVKQCKIIGVVIQSNLKWDAQIELIISNAKKKKLHFIQAAQRGYEKGFTCESLLLVC